MTFEALALSYSKIRRLDLLESLQKSMKKDFGSVPLNELYIILAKAYSPLRPVLANEYLQKIVISEEQAPSLEVVQSLLQGLIKSQIFEEKAEELLNILSHPKRVNDPNGLTRREIKLFKNFMTELDAYKGNSSRFIDSLIQDLKKPNNEPSPHVPFIQVKK